MTIAPGQPLPEGTFKRIGKTGVDTLPASSFFHKKKVVLFGVPGAFTPTCHSIHVPSFLEQASQMHTAGIDHVICLSVNDPFVMQAWEKTFLPPPQVDFLTDWNASWLRELGLTFRADDIGLGERSLRFALYAEDGIVKLMDIEPDPSTCHLSNGKTFFEKIRPIR